MFQEKKMEKKWKKKSDRNNTPIGDREEEYDVHRERFYKQCFPKFERKEKKTKPESMVFGDTYKMVSQNNAEVSFIEDSMKKLKNDSSKKRNMWIEPTIESKIPNHLSVSTVRFSPNQDILCCSGEGQSVIFSYLQDQNNYETQKTLHTGHKRSISSISFSSCGKFFSTCSGDKTIRIWNLLFSETGGIRRQQILIGHLGWVTSSLFFHQDPTKVVSCGYDKTIKIWDADKGKQILTLRGCEGSVRCIDLAHDNNHTVVSGDGEGTLRVWDLRFGECIKILKNNSKGFILSVHFHPTSPSIFASGSYDKSVDIFDIRTHKIIQRHEKHSNKVNSVHFHPSGKYIVSGSSDKTVKIFDTILGKVRFTLLDDDNIGSVNSVQFSPDGKYFALGCREKNKVSLWNFPLGKQWERIDSDERERVKFLIEDEFGEYYDGIVERDFVFQVKITYNGIYFYCCKSILTL